MLREAQMLDAVREEADFERAWTTVLNDLLEQGRSGAYGPNLTYV